jgi:paraquat-inducible protein B
LANSIQQVEKLLASPEIKSSMVTFNATLKDVQQLIRRVDQKIDPLSGELEGSIKQSRLLLENFNKMSGPTLLSAQETMKATTDAMNQARSTLLTIDQATGPNTNLDLALKDLSTAARSLRVLADYLERHPDALLYGKTSNGE